MKDRDRYFEKLELEMRSLVEGITLPEDALREVETYLDAAEYGLALESICGTVREENIVLKNETYLQIVALAKTMDLESQVFANLRTEKR